MKNLSNKNEVVIAFITDDNYVMPTVVAITSAIMNKNEDSIYKISVIGVSISEENKRILEEFVNKNINEKISIENLYFNKNYNFENAAHVTSSAIFKFDIPNILKDYDKVLYLDSDIIVLKDLSELFSIDISDFYAGVVKDYIAEDIQLLQNTLGIKNYFNSGVMLLNAKLLREDNVRDKLLDYRIKNNYSFMDQDSLNYIFNEKVKFMPPKYNYMYTIDNFDKKVLSDFFDCNINEDIAILHITHHKPWEDGEEMNKFFYIFWEYYQYTEYFKNNPIYAINKISKSQSTIVENNLNQKLKNNIEINELNIRELNNRINELQSVVNNLEKENKDRYSENWVKFFGIYNNKEYIFIYLFFIKFTIRMSEKNIKNISWWIPVKKWRDNFRNRILNKSNK